MQYLQHLHTCLMSSPIFIDCGVHNVFRLKMILLLLLLNAVRIFHNKPLEGIVVVLKMPHLSSSTLHTHLSDRSTLLWDLLRSYKIIIDYW